MGRYTIGEMAERSGFSASALRYYEDIGLVIPAGRSAAGYRIYDDRTLERLAFIARAKDLGCSLEEITDLVGLWDAGRCEGVQRRLHALVTDKLALAVRRITEVAAFANQLRAVAIGLGGGPPDGPCDEGCVCLAGTAPISCEPDDRPAGSDPGAPPACTLEPEAVPDRQAQWRGVLARARTATTDAHGALCVEFGHAITLGELAELVAAEQRCCAFFSFQLTSDDRGVALRVRAPAEAMAIVSSLVGPLGAGRRGS